MRAPRARRSELATPASSERMCEKAASSGAEDEDRNADRIAQQTEALEKLIKQRDALPKK